MIVAIAYSSLQTNSNGPSHKQNFKPIIGPVYHDHPEFKMYYEDRDFPEFYKPTLYYSPDNDITRRLLSGFPTNMTPYFHLVQSDNETEIDVQLSSINDYIKYSNTAGIIFEKTDEKSVKNGDISYKIKMISGSTVLEMTTQVFPWKFDQAPVDYDPHI